MREVFFFRRIICIVLSRSYSQSCLLGRSIDLKIGNIIRCVQYLVQKIYEVSATTFCLFFIFSNTHKAGG